VAQLSEVGSTPIRTEHSFRIARSAKEYIETNFHHPVHLEDLSRHTGVGIRVVQRCFRKHFDTTISDFLKAVRLDAANWELAVKYPGETNVKQVALHNGFTHLGRFSVTYRLRFGELPSETLAARPGD
jgi:transcriptional regulator GlxA family with amidase domain